MRIVLAQINPIVGSLKYNHDKIIKAIHEAIHKSADLIVFPELALCGYPPEDLLLMSSFILETEEKLKSIATFTKGITAIVGTVRQNLSNVGKPLFNSAAIITDQKIIGFQDKTLLPTYNVFDERRYFEPSIHTSIWEISGKKIAITICEDIWQQREHKAEFSDSRYHKSPIDELVKLKPDVVLNLSSSPFSINHLKARVAVCSKAATKINAPFLYCNQVGANDSLIFDGRSLSFDDKGQLMGIAKGFEEDLFVVDLPFNREPVIIVENILLDMYQALVLGVEDYFNKLGFKKAVIGLSGGIDSALVACITVDALGKENVLCIAMPSRFSSADSLEDARVLGKNLGCELKEISIEEPFCKYLELLEPHFENKDFDTTEENLQARIRGMILMAFSNKFGSIVLSTGNKSELALGYCTLYGDMCGGLAVISDLTKSEVYGLSKWINRKQEIIPWNTITKPPTAELKHNQKDQDTLPDYEIVDQVLTNYLDDHLSPLEISSKLQIPLPLVEDLVKRIHQNEYKRKQAPPGLRISEKAFTVGRRFPIVQRWI